MPKAKSDEKEELKAKTVFVKMFPGQRPEVEQSDVLSVSEINGIYKAIDLSNRQFKAEIRRKDANQKS